jgi:hypothetical protein
MAESDDFHNEKHELENKLADEKWRGHEQHHESIARSLTEYKEQSNEWRGSLADLRQTFAPIARVDSIEKDIQRRYEELDTRISQEREERRENQNLRTGTQRGITQGTAIIVGSVAFIGTVLSVVVIVVNFLS